MRIEMRRVQFIPKTLEAGILYVAEELGAAAHLCPCGCGAKVRTPLSPTDWSLSKTSRGPTLDPSIGNWQEPCKSHYWIRKGEIVWAPRWTEEEIAAGRKAEQKRAEQYYRAKARDVKSGPIRGVVLRGWRKLLAALHRRR